MSKPAACAGFPGVVAITLLAAACRDSVSPAPRTPARRFADTWNAAIVFDRRGGSLNENGTALIKGFDPVNPRHGDAIVVTFFWLGSTNLIQSVTDYLANGTPVGNTYTLVEYVTSGGISMATYVATNVRNYPESNDPQHEVLVLRATLASPVEDGGVMLSSFSGVNPVLAEAVGEHRSAAGAGSSATTAAPGPIAVVQRTPSASAPGWAPQRSDRLRATTSAWSGRLAPVSSCEMSTLSGGHCDVTGPLVKTA